MQDFFTSGLGPDILINLNYELSNFYLKQEEIFRLERD